MDLDKTEKEVEKFMLKNNRPYSVQDILNNYQSSMKKKFLEQSLEQLVKSGKVTLKEYGKAKVFLISQDRFPPVDPKLLDELDQ